MRNKIKRILFIVIITIVSLVLLIYLLLWLPPVQQKIKDIALKEVVKMTHNQMSIGKLKFHPFNKIELENVYAADQKGDTILYARQLSAGFDLIQLLNNRLLIKSVLLDDFTIRVSKDSLQSPFNFQFLIDAFSSPDTTAKKDSAGMNIEIDLIRLKRGQVYYDVFSEPALPDTLFDANHIHVYDLGTDIRLKSIDIQKLDAEIRQLSFKEKSGFELKNLELSLASTEKKISLGKGALQLPSSELSIQDGWVDYTGLEIGQIMKGASYNLSLKIDPLNPSDLKAFYSPLAQLSDSLSLEGEIAGTFPEVRLTRLKADYGKHVMLEADASIVDFNDWKHAPLKLNLDRFYIDPDGMRQVMILAGTSGETKNKIPIQSDPVVLAAEISGSLPGLNFHLNADSKTGLLDLKGKGGYLYDTGRSHFDVQLSATDFDLRTFMQGDTLYGKTTLHLNAQGEVSASGSVNARGNISVDRFDFNRYTYHDIQGKVAYIGDSLGLNLISNDPNLSLEMRGTAGLGKKAPHARLHARINHFRLDSLNYLPSYPGADLRTIIQADVRGFDPESMEAHLQLDSISFRTENGEFKEKSLQLDYKALSGSQKYLSIYSGIVHARVDGSFTFATLPESLSQTFSVYFPNVFPSGKKKKEIKDQLDFNLVFQNTDKLSSVFELPVTFPDSALLQGHYGEHGRVLDLQVRIPRFIVGTTPVANAFLDLKADTVNTRMILLAGANQWYETADTTRFNLKLENINESLALLFDFRNRTSQLDMTGAVDANIRFIPVKNRNFPDLEILLNPSVIHVNEEDFHIQPSRFTVEDKRYTVDNFAISHTSSEYLKLNGAVSGLPEDTLSVDLSHLQLQTIAEALKLDLHLGGEANGKIVLNQLLSTPLILTEGFSIRDIMLENKKIGTLNLVSGWSAERNGLFFKADLSNPGMPGSVLKGAAFPRRDSLYLDADIQGIMLDWLEPFTAGTLYGLKGQMGAKIQANGSLKKPKFNGIVFLKDAAIGVSMLNTLYSISDSVFIGPGVFDFKDFTIRDENQNTAVIRGSVLHQNLTHFNPKLSMDLNDFLVINNPNQTDSLFYGNLRIKGNLDASLSGKDVLLKASITHTPDSKIMINIPESAAEAQQYSSITFINTEGKDMNELIRSATVKEASFALPVRLSVSLSVNPGLTLGAVINPVTKDAVQVSGTGLIDFSYDLNNSAMNLLGDYTIKEGKCTLSLKNITRKTFTVQEGGKLTFKGDPMATAFDVTAVYSLRADLASLDPSFNEVMTTSTKVPVNCLLTATGDLNKMALQYRIVLQEEREEIQRKIDGLLYTDDIRIREIAYLLAFGTFMPVNSDGSKSSGPNIWTSLASSSITSQLNNLLSGVLSENWSIGTELHSGDGGFSDMEMDVNVSTRLFNDRLTLNSNIGYHNTTNSGNQNNFTGDFDVQYKLNRSGNVILKVYNVTNNQYYETARTTQGVGLIYRKESRTFKGLFRKIKALFQ